jgi:large subunit ribosomal protein L9
VVEVPDGFALNKLIPQKDAEAATPANLKRVQEKAKIANQSKENEVAEAKRIVEIFSKNPLQIKMEANPQGHLFQGVHASDVIKAAKEGGVEIPENFIKVEGVVKALGEATVKVSAGDYHSDFKIEVVAK